MKLVRWIVATTMLASLPIQPACNLRAKRSADFSALTTPIVYQAPKEIDKPPVSGIAAKAKSAAKDTVVFVGTGLLLAGGLIAWLWLNDDDDETFVEREAREQNERGWKRFWRDNPTVNPTMTAAYQDDL